MLLIGKIFIDTKLKFESDLIRYNNFVTIVCFAIKGKTPMCVCLLTVWPTNSAHARELHEHTLLCNNGEVLPNSSPLSSCNLI